MDVKYMTRFTFRQPDGREVHALGISIFDVVSFLQASGESVEVEDCVAERQVLAHVVSVFVPNVRDIRPELLSM